MNPYREAFIRLFYPAYCSICRIFLEIGESCLCRPCLFRLDSLRFSPGHCSVDLPFRYLDEGWAFYPYESPVKELITGLKFAKKRRLLAPLMDDLGPLVPLMTSEIHYDFLIPIPLDSRRFLERERHVGSPEKHISKHNA